MSWRDGPPVCKFFVQGRCLAGDRCRYAHPATSASRVEQNQAGGRNAVQQSGARRLLVPAPPSAAAQQSSSGGGGAAGSVKQRLGGAGGSGTCDAAEPAGPRAEDKAPPRLAWKSAGIKAAQPPSSAADQQQDSQKQEPVKSGSLASAYRAADFVPASAARQQADDPWDGSAADAGWEAQYEGWSAEQAPGYGNYSESADYSQSADYGQPGDQQGWYGSGNGDEEGGGWCEDGQPWLPAADAQAGWEEGGWGGGRSGGAEETLEQSLRGLLVDDDPHAQDIGQHGDWRLLCEICGKFVLDPEDDEQCAEHLQQCSARHERVAARQASATIECGICLERVMGKQPPSARKFGLLSCEHAFCLACIRSWRGTGDSAPTTDTARTCPLCRARSHFVTPSAVWPTSEQQKEDIVGGYVRHLASIDCRHFDFGEGSCPFGTSCFYRHAFPDGTLWQPTLRKVGDSEGGVKVVAPVRLSSFLERSPALRL